MRFSQFIMLVVFVLYSHAAAEPVDFARDVRPIFAKRCVGCHGPKKHEGGLRLDLRRTTFQGGDSGPAFVPGTSTGEALKRMVSKDEKLRMPLHEEPMPANELATLQAWAEQGAKWPDELAGQDPAANHWAFRTIKHPAVPSVRDRSRVRNPIDALLLAQLEASRFSFAPEADRRTLVRRLFLDLQGLPPPLGEIERFVQDASPNSYERLVDRLLASPHFGERWGRHWLDLARYAESDGYENDNLRPNAWRFRDWVVDAVNRDQPFDQFTIDQLAGDLRPRATLEQKVATGFHRNTLWNSAASGDKEEFRTLAIKDRTDTTGMAWMGLTLGCAQCHGHKYDPIAHREYYQLYAFFNKTDHDELKLPDSKNSAPVLREGTRPTRVHTRGSFLQPGVEVAPSTPAFLPPLKPRGAKADRLDLANWLVDPSHPLTARVAVNRYWMHLFGTGLVPTPENFGTNGAPPKHPELLDWLASEFVRQGWSRKAMIRLFVTSTAYRQSSNVPPNEHDTANSLFGRQNRFRVEAEIVRDLSLSTSGLLIPTFGGPSIVPTFPEGFLDQKFTAESLKMPGADRHRRGIYIHVQRTLPHPTLAAFDGADGNQPCARRDRSTTPLQALTLLNDPVFVEAARALGARLRFAGTTEESLRRGFELCLGRPPKERELSTLKELVAKQTKLGMKDEVVWSGIARVLLNLEEFTTRE